MKLLVFFFILAIYEATVKAQENADAPAEGNAEGNVGGCSAGVNGEANGDTNGAEGSASLGTSGCEGTAGYTYIIKATRTEQTIPPGYPILYLYYQVASTQNMTYFKNIRKDKPLTLEMYIENSDADFVYAGPGEKTLSVCEEYEAITWDYVAVSIVAKNLLPDGKCPVERGSYDIDQEVDPIKVTFADMIHCGTYQLYVNLNRGPVWAGQFGFTFTIEDDGSCIQ